MQETPDQVLQKGGSAFTQTFSFLRSPWLLIAGIAVVSTTMFFLFTWDYPMQNWDEGIHSQVTREIVDTGDWWTLHYQGELYFRKPPLKMWITAPLVKIFGDHVWVYRFWSSLAGVASAVLLSFFVYKKEKDCIAAWLAGLIFVSGQFIFYHAFRTGETDALLIFFLIVGFFAYWKASKKKWWFIVMGASFGLAVMTKSLAGVIGPLVICFDLFFRRDWKMLRDRYFWYGVFSFFVVASPWHISMLSIYGKQFWDEYIGFHVVDRTLTQLYADLPWYWYAKMLVQRLFPLSFFLIGGLLIPAWDFFQRKKQEFSLVIIWFAISLLLFTFVKTKFEWYILPAYAPAAWIVGRYLSRVLRDLRQPIVVLTFAVSLFLIFAKIPGAIPAGAKTFWFSLQAYIPEFFQQNVSNPYVWSALFIVILLVGSLIFFRKQKRIGTIIAACLIIHSLGFAFGRNIGTIYTESRESIYQQIAHVIARQQPSRIILYKTDLFDKPAGYFELYAVTRDIINVKDDDADLWKTYMNSSVLISSDESDYGGRKLLDHIDRYFVYGKEE